jgi:hypothetical protein
MELHLLLILLNAPNHFLIPHPHRIQQRNQIIRAKMAIWTTMRLARPRRMFRQNLLAAVRRIPIAPTIRVASHIAVRVTDIISIFFIKCIVCDLRERGAPEYKAFFEVKTNAFQEERVLEAAVVL